MQQYFIERLSNQTRAECSEFRSTEIGSESTWLIEFKNIHKIVRNNREKTFQYATYRSKFHFTWRIWLITFPKPMHTITLAMADTSHR